MENPFEESKAQRPMFLTVVCILTFVGSGFSIISNLFSMFTAGLLNNGVQMERYTTVLGNMENGHSSAFLSGLMNSSMEVLQASAAHGHAIAVMGIVLCIISLIAAIMMFQLRRLGFYFYTGAQILSLFVLPYFAGFSLLVVLGMIWAGISVALFIILYALNLKYMR